MITVLTGSNGFELKAELDRLVSAFLHEHGDMGLERLDGEEVSYDRMREALESLPFLASKKLVVLRAPSANKEFTEKAEQLLGAVPETTDVIVVEPKLDKRLAYYKFLKKTTDFHEFAEHDEQTLSRWMVAEATKLGASLSSSDARYMIERLGTNQHSLANELRKLAAYDEHITREAIDTLTEPNPQSTIFQLVESAFAGNPKHALCLYQEQRLAKVEPLAIIGMLAWQLHVLAVIKAGAQRGDADIAREAKLNPFVVRKSRAITSRLTLEQLKQLIRELAVLDHRLKTTSLDADDALQHYLLTLSA